MKNSAGLNWCYQHLKWKWFIFPWENSAHTQQGRGETYKSISAWKSYQHHTLQLQYTHYQSLTKWATQRKEWQSWRLWSTSLIPTVKQRRMSEDEDHLEVSSDYDDSDYKPSDEETSVPIPPSKTFMSKMVKYSGPHPPNIHQATLSAENTMKTVPGPAVSAFELVIPNSHTQFILLISFSFLFILGSKHSKYCINKVYFQYKSLWLIWLDFKWAGQFDPEPLLIITP